MRSRPNPEAPSLAVRAAVWIGGAFGRWQRRRTAARDDSFVDAWKAAWNEGCEAQKSGRPQGAVPYARSPRKDAWLAGWLWADRQREAIRSPATRSDEVAPHRQAAPTPPAP